MTKLFLTVALALCLGGCARGALGVAPLTPRCATLSDRADLWQAIGASAAALSGAGGLAALPIDDKTGRIVVATSTVVIGALAIASQMVATKSASSFAAECK